MNRYRAILVDPEDTTAERPLQIFGNDFEEVKSWAEKVIMKAVGKHAHVDIYETKESSVYRVSKPAEVKS